MLFVSLVFFWRLCVSYASFGGEGLLRAASTEHHREATERGTASAENRQTKSVAFLGASRAVKAYAATQGAQGAAQSAAAESSVVQGAAQAFASAFKEAAAERELRARVAFEEKEKTHLKSSLGELKSIARDCLSRLRHEVANARASAKVLASLRAQLKITGMRLERATTSKALVLEHASAAERSAAALRAELAATDRLTARQGASLHEDAAVLASLRAQAAAAKLSESTLERTRLALKVNWTQQAATRAMLESSGQRGHAELLEHVSTLQEETRRASENDTKAVAKLRNAQGAATAELASVRERLVETSSQIAASEKHASAAGERIRALESQIASLNRSASEVTAKDEQEIRNTMLGAAMKLSTLEDRADALSAELERARAALTAAEGEAEHSRDAEQQQTDAALQETRRAESLSDELEAVKTAAAQNQSKATDLRAQVVGLQGAREQADHALSEKEEQIELWRRKVGDIDGEAEASAAAANVSRNSSRGLRERVLRLTQQGDRADTLAAELDRLQAAAAENATSLTVLSEQMDRVRDLKDRGAAELDTARSEGADLHARGADLEGQVASAKAALAEVAKTGKSVLDELRVERSHLNEYFDQTTQWQQQNEALETKVNDGRAAANRSADEVVSLRAQVDALKEEARREQQISKVSDESNERDLFRSREDVSAAATRNNDLKAELDQVRNVLTSSQRQRLGLSSAMTAAVFVELTTKAPEARPQAEDADGLRMLADSFA